MRSLVRAGRAGVALARAGFFGFFDIDDLPMRAQGPIRLARLLEPRGLSPAERGRTLAVLPAENVRRVGFSEEESLLPPSPRSFEGYRLLREYFAFSQRLLFLGFDGFSDALGMVSGEQMDLVVPLRQADTRLENRVNQSSFELFCTPVINLFSKQLDRIELSEKFTEFHVVADHNRPLDFEVFEIQSVTGYGAETGQEQEFRPFYLARDADTEAGAFYTLNRVPRMLTSITRV